MLFAPQKLGLPIALALALGGIGQTLAQERGDIPWDDDSPGYTESRPPALSPEGFHLTDFATTPNGRRVAQALDEHMDLVDIDSLPEDEYEKAGALAEELRRLPAGDVGVLLEQLAGTPHANLGAATLNSMEPVSAGLLQAMRQPGASTPDLTAQGRLWVQGLGNSGHLDSNRDSKSMKHNTQGVLIGADWSLSENWRMGVMGGKSGTRFNAQRFEGDLDSWHLGAYAQHQSGPWGLRLGAVHNNHAGQNKRTLGLPGGHEQLEGKYDARSQMAFAELGYQLGGSDFSIEPFASLGYQRYKRERFMETGGLGALNVGPQTLKNPSSTLGIRLAGEIRMDDQMSLTPHLSTQWKHLYGDVASTVRQSSAHLSNTDFTLNGIPLDRNSLAVHTGLDWGVSAQHTLGVAYTAQIGSNSRSHGLTGQWRMNF